VGRPNILETKEFYEEDLKEHKLVKIDLDEEKEHAKNSKGFWLLCLRLFLIGVSLYFSFVVVMYRNGDVGMAVFAGIFTVLLMTPLALGIALLLFRTLMGRWPNLPSWLSLGQLRTE